MAALRPLLLILTAMLLAVGGLARAETPTAEPPCHETPAQTPEPGKATAAVNCCVGCMPAAQGLEVQPARIRAATPARYPLLVLPLSGLAPEPEPRPPRA
ncbi:MAG TPA: hypothetical protein VEA44_05110 [Caulobacter sp.]|nr:hypothetical protein [Caulobacter sp.]